MALLPQDRRGQILLALTVAAVAGGYFLSCGPPFGSLRGLQQLAAARDSVISDTTKLSGQVKRARAVLRSGSEERLQQRLEEYRAHLDLMRQLVPLSGEVPNLLDDISSRAKIRGANVINFVPQPLESGSPFDTQRFRFTVTGRYDQVGEFLADIASLPRIIVPYNVHLARIESPTADTTLRSQEALLQANFHIRTFVKAAPADTAAPSPQRSAGG